MKQLVLGLSLATLASCASGAGLRLEDPPPLGTPYYSRYQVENEATAGADDTDLAKKTQNPVSDLISLPFQNNYQGDFGKDNDGRNVLNMTTSFAEVAVMG